MRLFVYAILVNQVGELLLYQRNTDEKEFPNSWSLVGGEIKTETSAHLAVLYRIEESIGLNYTLVQSMWLFESVYKEDQKRKEFYFVVNTTAELRQLVLKHGKDLEYFRIDQIMEIDLAFNITDILKRYLKIT